MQIFKTIIVFILICVCVSGCKSKTVEEAFYKNHKKESREIVYQGSVMERPEISKIDIIDKYNQLIEGTIVQTNWKRVFYSLVEMNELRLTAYDKDNRMIMEIPRITTRD